MNQFEKNRILWITWEEQVRNRSMANGLQLPLYEILSDRIRLLRFISCIVRTVMLLFHKHPAVVIGQNPSTVLTLLLFGLKSFFGYKVVVDAHFGGVDAGNGSMVPQRILDWCNRAANLVIVTNENHARYINNLGGKSFICPDPLPDLARYGREVKTRAKKVLLICSYDIDEPFLEVFKAAEIVASEGFDFFISGNFRKAGIVPQDFPHLKLLGFVSVEDYYRHLFSSELVIDLTDNEDCLVCGAYEALSAGKPLILSRKKVLLEYFTAGTVFTENKALEIAAAVKTAYRDRNQLAEDANMWSMQVRKDMKQRMAELRCLLESLGPA